MALTTTFQVALANGYRVMMRLSQCLNNVALKAIGFVSASGKLDHWLFPSPHHRAMALDVLSAGLGAAITDSIFNPLAMITVRLQVPRQVTPIVAAL